MSASPDTRCLPVHAGGLAVCAALGLAFYAVGVQPLLTQRDFVQERNREMAVQWRNGALAGASVRSATAQLAALRAEIEASPLRLQPSERLNSRPAEVAALASREGLEIQNVWPGEAAPGPRYNTVPVRLSGRGRFANCVRFVHHVREKFLDSGVATFRLAGNPEEPGAPVVFDLELLWFTAPDATASAAAD